MADGKLVFDVDVNSENLDDFINSLPEKVKKEIGQASKEIDRLSTKFGELASEYFALTDNSKGSLIFKSDAKEAEKLKGEIRSVIKEIEKLTGDKVISIKGITDLDDGIGKLKKNTDINFKQMGNTIKKFALALISVRSAYALVSRASSAYLSQDTELAQKLKSVWIGLGSFLAPVLEFISNALLKALGYLNVFIKALTGIDFLARANAKALKQQASAQKELNNQTYDFDVIRKQQDTTSGGSGGGLGDNGLFDIPELDEKIVKKLQDLAHWLKENWNWIKLVGEALIAVFGAVAIGKLLKSIGGLLGAEGLGGLWTILSDIIAIGVIVIGVDLIYKAITGRDLYKDIMDCVNGFKELEKSVLKNTDADKQYSSQLEEHIDKTRQMIDEGNLNNNMLEQHKTLLDQTAKSILNEAKNIENQTLKTKEMTEQEKVLKEQMDLVLNEYEYLYQQGLLNKEQVFDYIDAIDKQIKIMETLGQDTTDLRQRYEKLTGHPWNLQINSNIQTVKNLVNDFFTNLNNKINTPRKLKITMETISDAGRKLANIFGFAQGGIVTQPTRALIGEAGYPEAVVPMEQDYLSTLAQEIARYGGGSGGSQNISLYLDGRLIQRQTASRQQQRNFITNK